MTWRRIDPKSYTSIRIPKDALAKLEELMTVAGIRNYLRPPKPWQWTHRGGLWSRILHLAQAAADRVKALKASEKRPRTAAKARKKVGRRRRKALT